MTVKTKKVADRRTLRFGRMSEILVDINSFDNPSVTACGNWTPAQIVQHLARTIKVSLDGTSNRVPFIMRMFASLVKSSTLNKPMKPGFSLPKSIIEFKPDDNVTWEKAVEDFTAQIRRIENGDRMNKPSPAFGELSHEQWEQLHCRHSEMHLSFLKSE